MNAGATLVAAAAAVYFLIAGAYVRLSAIRRLGREYGFFAVTAAGLGIASVGGTLEVLAVNAFEADRALRTEHFGIQLTLFAFAHFAYANVDRPTGRAGHVAAAVAVISMILCLGGALFDPGHAMAMTLGLGRGQHIQPRVTAITMTLAVLGLLSGAWITSDVAREARSSLSGRYVFGAVVVAIAGWLFVMGARPFGYAFGPWYVVAIVPFVMAVAVRLVERWVDVDALLARRSAELAAAVTELQDAQAELVRREQLAAVGELSAVIAHEVRNPLAVLKNAVAGLRRAELTPDLRETLHGILDQETDRLNRLVRDLLSYAKPVHVAHVDVDLVALLERAVDHARRAVGPDAQAIEVHTDLDLPETVKADPDLLERALVHVIENAFEAMPNGGRLEVLGRRRSEGGVSKVAVSIVDSGEGMDTLVRSRAKEPFFTTRRQGTGLGLAIVERVAFSHGGRLELEREPDGGTRVTLVIPVAETKPARSDPPNRSSLLGRT